MNAKLKELGWTSSVTSEQKVYQESKMPDSYFREVTIAIKRWVVYRELPESGECTRGHTGGARWAACPWCMGTESGDSVVAQASSITLCCSVFQTALGDMDTFVNIK